ncbi:MAG TPA: hypothetical protein VNI60_04850 [Pyrinomonadaceae bacterium]|nr:hypothetical protein [Pyrinomonadaceae bacterium]
MLQTLTPSRTPTITTTKMKKIKCGATEFESKVQNLKFNAGNSKFKVQSSKFNVEEICNLYSRFSQIFCFSLIFLILPNFACVNQSLLKGNKNIAVVVEKNNVSDYERDLQTMKTANFDYIFAFRRKDGGTFDSEDKKYLRANTPTGTNRFVSTDEGRVFIAGSTYVFSPENLEALRSRFLVEDYSKPEAELQNMNQIINANR